MSADVRSLADLERKQLIDTAAKVSMAVAHLFAGDEVMLAKNCLRVATLIIDGAHEMIPIPPDESGPKG